MDADDGVRVDFQCVGHLCSLIRARPPRVVIAACHRGAHAQCGQLLANPQHGVPVEGVLGVAVIGRTAAGLAVCRALSSPPLRPGSSITTIPAILRGVDGGGGGIRVVRGGEEVEGVVRRSPLPWTSRLPCRGGVVVPMSAKTKSLCQSIALQLLRQLPLINHSLCDFPDGARGASAASASSSGSTCGRFWVMAVPASGSGAEAVGAIGMAKLVGDTWSERARARSRSSARTADRDFSPAPQQALGRERTAPVESWRRQEGRC
jgi:hypothetical protein